MVRILIAVVLLAVFASGSGPALASEFDVNGYRQGASREEVMLLAEKRGHRVTRHEYGLDIYNGIDQAQLLQFCKKRLHRISWIFDGGFMAAIRVINHHVQNGGFKISHTEVGHGIGYNAKQSGQMSVFLTKERMHYYITVALFAQEDRGISNGQIAYTGGNCPDKYE